VSGFPARVYRASTPFSLGEPIPSKEIHMRKMSYRVLVALGAALLFGTFAGCSSDVGDDDTPKTVSSTVYALTQTPGSLWPNLKVGVSPLAGKSISHLTFTFAVDANMLLSAAGYGYNLEYNSLWSTNQTAPTAPKAWTKSDDVATLTWSNNVAYTPVADQAVDICNWYTGTAACTYYVKQINITYSDATTEVITFTTTTATPVHIVATAGTTDVAFADRLWVSDWTSGDGAVDASLTSGLTQGVTTVSF
jgi:hypothetical protein